jgi:hypothetical protein
MPQCELGFAKTGGWLAHDWQMGSGEEKRITSVGSLYNRKNIAIHVNIHQVENHFL